MDASFFETMRSDGDLTLCLSVRYWMYSTSGNAVQLLRLLTDFIYPEHVRNAEEANTEGVRILFRAVKKGAGSFRNFIAKLESAFAQTQGRDAQEPILLLHNYLHYAAYYTPRPDGNDAAETCLLRTVTKSVTLWRSLFLLLNRATHDRAVWGPDEAGTVYERVLGLLGASVSNVGTHHPAEARGFISFLGRAGMFDALDVALPVFASTHKETTIHLIPLLMESIRYELLSRPAILYDIRKQFPRPLSVRALLDSVNSGENRVPIPQIFSHSDLRSAIGTREAMHIHPWYEWHKIEWNCLVAKQCMRRGCTKRRRAKCRACMSQEYCGSLCQNIDWAEHRLLCGYKLDIDELNMVTLRMPFRFSTDAP